METANSAPQENKPGRSFLGRITNWWKRFVATFSRERKNVDDPKDQLNKIDDVPYSIKQLSGNLENELLHYNKSLLHPDVEKYFQLSIKFMTESGIGDGVEGIKGARNREITVIAQSRAEHLFKLAKTGLSGLNTKARTDAEAKRKLRDRNEQEDSQQHRYLELLQYYKHHHPRSFNGFWGLICLATGIFLVFADIPLSKKLFEEGFNFRQGQGLSMAIGISLCTIFIKIFYDNYIDLKYGHALITRSKFREMFNSVLAENAIGRMEENEEQNEAEQKGKRYWHNSIMIFTIIGVVILGIFRVESVKFANHGHLNIMYGIYLATFVFLSLIFPIISGVCLSAGFSVWENIFRFFQTKNKCTKSEERYIRSLTEYTAAQKEQADIQSEMEKWDKEEYLNSYRDILLSYYDNGYKLGAANPDFGNRSLDFFLLADHWRNRALARKTNNHIIKISGL
ncbi:hypothetical protein [Ferruginibacter profundus]